MKITHICRSAPSATTMCSSAIFYSAKCMMVNIAWFMTINCTPLFAMHCGIICVVEGQRLISKVYKVKLMCSQKSGLKLGVTAVCSRVTLLIFHLKQCCSDNQLGCDTLIFDHQQYLTDVCFLQQAFFVTSAQSVSYRPHPRVTDHVFNLWGYI